MPPDVEDAQNPDGAPDSVSQDVGMLSANEADACPSISRAPTAMPITHSVLLIVAMRNVPIGYKPAVALPCHEERKAHGVFVIADDNPLSATRGSIGSRLRG